MFSFVFASTSTLFLPILKACFCKLSFFHKTNREEIAVHQNVHHIFGAKGSPTCANFALKRNATDNEATFPEATHSVENKFYMDDDLESSPTVKEATRKAQHLVKMLARGRFTLTRCLSNVSGVLSTLHRMENILDGNVKALVAKDESSHVLGLIWKYQFDTLVVSHGNSPDRNRTLTQRVVLSLVSAVYDPIGPVAPYTVKTRLLLKVIWRLSGQQRDDNFPDHIAEKFCEWSDDLRRLTGITIPRSYFEGQLEKLQLHIFADSSQDVFSSLVFLQEKVIWGCYSKTELAFVFGEAKVAPMKPLTITKLELQAVLLSARPGDEIWLALTLPVERTFRWTASNTVFQWLQTTDKLPVFVANRVAEILELTTTEQWNYVWTSDKPTDAGTRGLSANASLESYFLKGPDFVKTDDCPFQPSLDVLRKIKKNQSKSHQFSSEPEKQEVTAVAAKCHQHRNQLSSGRSIARTRKFCAL